MKMKRMKVTINGCDNGFVVKVRNHADLSEDSFFVITSFDALRCELKKIYGVSTSEDERRANAIAVLERARADQ